MITLHLSSELLARGLQVCAEGFKVLAGTSTLQEVAVEALAPSSAVGPTDRAAIVSASFCDPYLLLQLSSGSAVLLCANPDTGGHPQQAVQCR